MKKKGVLMVPVVVFIICFMLLMASGVMYTSQFVRNIKNNELQTECSIIDRSLEAWATSHKQVRAESVVVTEKGIMYEQQRAYPNTLADLGELQSRGFFAKNIDLSKFKYTTQNDGTAYHLEVTLTDGSTYKSPQSTY